MIPAPLAILWAFGQTKRRLARLDTPARVAAHQALMLKRQLERLATTIPFYEPYRGQPLDAWPILDKAAMLANFGALNRAGIGADEAWSAAGEALRSGNTSGRVRGLTVGMSTGTSGNRGLFLISDRERYRWLGSILARTMPDFPWVPHRVAVMMPSANQLYATAGQSRRLDFAFFDVRDGVTAHRARLEAFQPDIIVAPPKALRLMAEEGIDIAPRDMFSGGEVLDPLDAAAVKERYGLAVRPIYQATEGFLGVTCKHGTMHLNEDTMLFEREPVAGGGAAFTPVITDLVRTTQAMVRYRLNDILIPAPTCSCGSPLQPIARIEGRMDDLVVLRSAGGRDVPILPSTLRDAILDAGRSLTDFRVIQTGPDELAIALPQGTGEATQAAVEAAIIAASLRAGAAAPKLVVHLGIETPFDRKLRRVERRWTGEP